MGISRATYYHQPVRRQKQLERDLALKAEIERIQLDLPGYGYRRIYEHLANDGKSVNSKRIRRVMKAYGLFSCIKKLMRPRGSQTGIKIYYPNLLQGHFVSGPNQVWVTDLTYIRLRSEFVYLSAILDVYTRKIVGWAISRDLSHKFCLEALKSALKQYGPQRDVIHHSDRGVQYSCVDYITFLQEHGFKISMSRLATPQDNAYIESFFKTLKRVVVYLKNYRTMGDVV
jgi:transposase InsO family protein